MRLADAVFRQGHLSEQALVEALMTGDRPAVGFEPATICHAQGPMRWNGRGNRAVWTHNTVKGAERPDHPWFVVVQFHPELKCRPFDPHPLFAGFVGAAIERRASRADRAGVV